MPAREDGEEDELPTARLAQEVGKVAHGGLDDLRTTSSGGQSGMPSRVRSSARQTGAYPCSVMPMPLLRKFSLWHGEEVSPCHNDLGLLSILPWSQERYTQAEAPFQAVGRKS